MKNLSIVFCTLLSILLLTSCELFDPPNEIAPAGIVTGVVLDKLTGQTVQGADVSVTGLKAGQTVTGSQGIYRFEDLPVGEYTVVCSKLGYKANTTITVVKPGQSTNGQISLEPYTTLIASSYILDFGNSQNNKSFTIFNPLSQSVTVTVQTSHDWITVTPANAASIESGRDFPFNISINRNKMPRNGVNEGTVTLQTANNGAPTVKIAAIR